MHIRRTLIASLALILIVASAATYGALHQGSPVAPIATQPAITVSPAPLASPTLPARATATLILPSATPSLFPSAAIPTLPAATPTLDVIRPTPLTATPTVPAATPTGDLTADVQALRARDLPTTNSVTVIVLGGAEVHLDDTRADYPASTVKLPIYLTLAHRIQAKQTDLTWETMITVHPADIVGGTGVLQSAPGSTHSMREIAQLMILESDNVAANLILGRLGGAQDTSRDHLEAGAAIVTEYLTTLGIRGMTLRHGLQDPQAFTDGTFNTTTSAALAQLLLVTERDQTTLDGATEVLALLGQRGAHNPWHLDAVTCDPRVQRIGGIYPPTANRPTGVRLDALLVTTPGNATRYILAVSVPTTTALERTVEAQIARFEGDLELLLTGRWAQCVDSTTRQATP